MKHEKNRRIRELITTIVDDDKIHQFVMARLLKQAGISDRPVIFSNGGEFISWLSENPSNQKNILVFLDIHMPMVDGWEVLAYLEKPELINRLFVTVVTASIDPSYRERALAYPMVIDFKVKPLLNDYIDLLKASPIGQLLNLG